MNNINKMNNINNINNINIYLYYKMASSGYSIQITSDSNDSNLVLNSTSKTITEHLA